MKYDLLHPVADDIDKLDPKDCYSLGDVGCTKTLVQMSWVGKTKDSICLAFVNQGKFYGVAGSYRNWAGVAQGWAIFDRAVDEHPIALTKTCVTLIKYAQKEQELRRLSLTVRSGYTKGDKFARALGFVLEGEMKKFLPDGSDAWMYARLF